MAEAKAERAKKKRRRKNDDGVTAAPSAELAARIGAAFASLKAALDSHGDARDDRDDKEAWLLGALEVWRMCPTASLSLLIEKISEHLNETGSTRTPPAISEARGEAREARWLAIAASEDSLVVGCLLTTPWPEQWAAAFERLTALARFPPDPRITMALIGLIDAMPYSSGLSAKFWTELSRTLLRHSTKAIDTRSVDAFAAVAAKPTGHYRKEQITGLWTRTLASLRRNAVSAGDNGDGHGAAAHAGFANEEIVQAAIARLDAMPLAARAKAKGEAEFLSEIYTAPHDAGLREVFCDWLLERGDPRGEFMSLQLARAAITPEGASTTATDGDYNPNNVKDPNEEREADLLKDRDLRTRICGKLEHVIETPHVEDFDRGFLARACLSMSDAQAKAAVAFEEWATVLEITFPANYSYRVGAVSHESVIALIMSEKMRSLRGLYGVTPRLMTSITDALSSSLSTSSSSSSLSAPRPEVDDVLILTDPYPDREAQVAVCATMPLPPSVKRLQLAAMGVKFDWIFQKGSSTPAIWREGNIIEHLSLRRYGGDAHADLERLLTQTPSPKLRSFDLAELSWGRFQQPAGFCIGYAQRRDDDDGDGGDRSFSRVTVRYTKRQSRYTTLSDDIPKLADLLGRIPADLPRELVFNVRFRRLAADQRQSIEKAIARFKHLDRCVLPWA